MEAYRTIYSEASVELIIRKSRFIGQCIPVSNESSAKEALESIKKKYWNASHNPFAYSLRQPVKTARYSDDGEPAGTAGLPILKVINNRELFDLIVVVTRYFGGVLLGAGGLVRAYALAAGAALDEAGLVEMKPCERLKAKMSYSEYAALEALIRTEAALINAEFGEGVSVEVSIPKEKSDAFIELLLERTDGRVKALPISDCLGAFRLN